MAVEQTATTLRDTARPQAVPLPPTEFLTSEGIINQLQITDQEALKPGNLVPFLASQSAKLMDITARPEIKTLAAEIPPYVHSEGVPLISALSHDEQTALEEWRRERVLVSAQAGDQSLDDLTKEIQGYVDDVTRNHPEMFQPEGSGSSAGDVLEQMFTNQMVEETEESKRKYQELLVAARGDPEAVLLAMTYRHARNAMVRIGSMLEAYKTHMDAVDRTRAQLELDGFRGDLSASDLAKANMDFARNQGDAMNIFQTLQVAMNDYEKTMQSGGSLAKSINESLRSINANLKAG